MKWAFRAGSATPRTRRRRRPRSGKRTKSSESIRNSSKSGPRCREFRITPVRTFCNEGSHFVLLHSSQSSAFVFYYIYSDSGYICHIIQTRQILTLLYLTHLQCTNFQSCNDDVLVDFNGNFEVKTVGSFLSPTAWLTSACRRASSALCISLFALWNPMVL